MPSRKSKPTRKARPPSPKAPDKSTSAWKDARGCSEEELRKIAEALAAELKAGDRVLLEGVMGAGKTTFSRYLLLALNVEQPPEGSPTFAIAHEYLLARHRTEGSSQTALSGVVHVDLYRIRSEEEIDERGIPDYYWDERKIVISEWTSMWPEFQQQVLKTGRNWQVALEISDEAPDRRHVRIMRPERRQSAR